MEILIDFINYIVEIINNLADSTDGFFERMAVWIGIWFIETKLAMIQFVYGIAFPIIEQIGISDMITDAWSGVDSELVSVLAYLRVPEAINIIMSSVVTRFVLDMLP